MSASKRTFLYWLPSAVQGCLSLVMIPMTTYVLSPEDFGVFALALVIPALIMVVGVGGASYLLAQHYPVITYEEKRWMISTMVLIGGATLLLLGAGFLLFCSMIASYWPAFATVPYVGLVLSVVSMVLTFPWVIATEVMTLDGRADSYATVTVIQSIGSSVALVLGLFGFGWGVLSLFVASSVGAAIACLGGVLFLRPYLLFVINQEWMKKIFNVGLPMVSANLMETFETFVERFALSTYVGLGQLGMYSHSQQYRGLVAASVKAVARSMWPITLEEVHDSHSTFPRTKKAWELAYVGVTALGLVFAAVGDYLLAFWTHDKFTEAFPLVVVWMVFILLQNSGKAHTGVLYAYGQGVYYSRMMAIAAGVGIVLLLVFVPKIGAVGAVLAIVVQQIIFRLGIQVRAKKYQPVPNQDAWAATGAFMILIALEVKQGMDLGVGQSLALLVVACSSLGIMARHQIGRAVSTFTRVWGFEKGQTRSKVLRLMSQ